MPYEKLAYNAFCASYYSIFEEACKTLNLC